MTVGDKLDYALTDAETSKPDTHEETVGEYRAEEDILESMHRVTLFDKARQFCVPPPLLRLCLMLLQLYIDTFTYQNT